MGRMGITHYSIINANQDVEIVAVADSSALILTMLTKYLPVRTYKNYDIMFSESKPDAILVCTPPTLHYSIAKKAAE